MAKLSPMMIVPPAIFVAVAGLFVAGMFLDKDGQELPSALVGQGVPALPEGGLPGFAEFDGSVMADGTVKLVNFWASWCGPCRVEHPNLAKLADAGLRVYGVNYKDQPGAANAFLAELGNPYAGLLTDDSGRAALDWGVYGVPETYIIGPDGTILGRMAGPVTTTTMEQRLYPVLEAAGVSIRAD